MRLHTVTPRAPFEVTIFFNFSTVHATFVHILKNVAITFFHLSKTGNCDMS